MKYIIIILSIYFFNCSSYGQDSIKKPKDQDQPQRYPITKKTIALYTSYIIPIDTIMTEVDSLISRSFNKLARQEKFANNSVSVTISLKQNGKIKRVYFEKDTDPIIKKIIKEYIEELEYFNHTYRNEEKKIIVMKESYIVFIFDQNGYLVKYGNNRTKFWLQR